MPPNKDDSLRLIESAIRLSAHVLARDKTQLASQLLGRLTANTNDDTDALRAGAVGYTDTAWLEPGRATLQAAGGPLIRTLDGHSNSVNAVALAADGRTIVSGSTDNTIKVWDLNSGDCLRTLDGHSNPVFAVALAADRRTIVSGSGDKTIKVWDLKSGDCRRTLDGHSNAVYAVALSADGQTIVSGSGDNTIKVWNLNSGDCRRTLDGHSNACTPSPSPRWTNHRLRLQGQNHQSLGLKLRPMPRTLDGHSDWVSAVALSPMDKPSSPAPGTKPSKSGT